MFRFVALFDPWFLAFGFVLDAADCAISMHVGPFSAMLYWEPVDADQ